MNDQNLRSTKNISEGNLSGQTTSCEKTWHVPCTARLPDQIQGATILLSMLPIYPAWSQDLSKSLQFVSYKKIALIISHAIISIHRPASNQRIIKPCIPCVPSSVTLLACIVLIALAMFPWIIVFQEISIRSIVNIIRPKHHSRLSR